MDSNQLCAFTPCTLDSGDQPCVFAPCTTDSDQPAPLFPNTMDSDQPCVFAPCTTDSSSPYKKRRLPLEIFQRIVIYSSAYYLYAQANCSQGVRSVSAQTFNKK